MSGSLKGKLLAGFVLVFVAGLAAGAFLGAMQMQRHHFDFFHHHSLALRVRHRFQSRLQLTPEQVRQAEPIVNKTVRQLEAIRAETGKRVHETFLAADRELAPQLTEKQRARLKTLETAHRQNPEPGSPSPSP
ncbi:MAG TPA: hypothetical protein VII74_04290 [Chthoniobacterales bacterium]